jgi:hypothetical protein
MTSALPQAAVTIRVGEKGEPSLLKSTTSHYSWLYNDSGSGADMDVTLWRPTPTDVSYAIIGDYAQGNYNDPTGSSILVKALNDDPDSPLLKPPEDYRQVWNDQGSGGDNDGSVWWPVAPDGYVAIGALGQSGYDKPAGVPYACVRQDYCTPTGVLNTIWTDAGSGAHGDVSLFTPTGVVSAFVAQPNHNPWTGTAYQLTKVN